MVDTRPALVVCAHGTDDPDGRQVVLDVVAQTREARPDLQVHDAYVDVQQPGLGDVVDRLAPVTDVVVVPLLLSYGYHLEVDVAEATSRHPGVCAAGSLGPHPWLADVLVERVREAGADDGDAVVVAVAGSSREAATADAEQMRRLVVDRWTGPVSLGYCAADEPRVADAVEQARAAGRRTVVAAYLVGPGFFHDGLARSGADLVSAPLGAHPKVVETLLARHAEVTGQQLND